MKISKGGQVSIPALIRKRWDTGTVALEDLGDGLVITPARDDPIGAAEGSLADEFGGLAGGELRRRARQDDEAAGSRDRIVTRMSWQSRRRKASPPSGSRS